MKGGAKGRNGEQKMGKIQGINKGIHDVQKIQYI